MPDMPGDKFISKGRVYELQPGPKGNLRPYTRGPVAAPPVPLSPGVIVAVAVVAAAYLVWRLCEWLASRRQGLL